VVGAGPLLIFNCAIEGPFGRRFVYPYVTDQRLDCHCARYISGKPR
jgi:hypothetical protein